MIIGVEYADSIPEYIDNVQNSTKNTFLEGISEIYRNNIDQIRFYLRRFEVEDNNFIGSSESLIIEGLDIENIRYKIRSSNLISQDEVLRFMIETLEFVRESIKDRFSSDTEYIESLSHFYSKLNDSADQSKLKSILLQKYDSMDSDWDSEDTFIIPDIIECITTMLRSYVRSIHR